MKLRVLETLIVGPRVAKLLRALGVEVTESLPADERESPIADLTQEASKEPSLGKRLSLGSAVSKVRLLQEALGGQWSYHAKSGSWSDASSERQVDRVAGCSCDDLCDHSPRYYLYEPGQEPKLVLFTSRKVSFL